MLKWQLLLRILLLVCFSPGSVAQEGNEESKIINVAGIFDTSNFDWGQEIFDFTVSLINNHTDGWQDDILNDGSVLRFSVADSKCDETLATQAYWDLRTEWDGIMHGVVGCRCSGASIALARIAGLEGVTQVSPSSTSSKLSDLEEFPFFSRVVAPGDARGEVGAMVSMLRAFGWERVTILNTDTQYAKDVATEFRRVWEGEHVENDGEAWEGKVAYSRTIVLDSNGDVDADSVRQALDSAPVDDPTVNSRIILLAAHDQHAYPILKVATEMNFQPDSVWVGPQSWVGRPPPDGDTSWMPPNPGYLGVTPFRNRDAVYQDYLRRLQESQLAQGKKAWTELSDYATEYTVDAILSLAMALSSVPHAMRRDGGLVTSGLRNLTFNGISGPVGFTEEGDRRDPKFTIFNLQEKDGDFTWVDVGSTGTEIGSAALDEGSRGVCFAEVGCGVGAPSDSYPVPPDKLETWVIVIIPVIVFLFLALLVKYWRSRRSKRTLKEKIDSELLDIDQQVEAAKQRQAALILERQALQAKPDTWSETDERLVEVSSDSEQYWTVADRLQETMGDAHISKLWRIQNISLWSYYSFHKDRFGMNQIKNNERSVWHGTSSLDPAVIYNDQQDGFMMQFSRDGFWGRGIYFADNSNYSYSYSYKPPPASWPLLSSGASNDDRGGGMEDEREMFLAKLLVGNSALMNRDESPNKAAECRALTVPPTDPNTGLKYNTVTGHTGGSQVWIVYENGRAYPDYLVRYYRGERDPGRTPFKSKQEAMRNSSRTGSDDSDSHDVEMGSTASSTGSDCSNFEWEFQDNTGWKPYSSAHQITVENAYQAFIGIKQASSSKVQIKSDEWTYEVDVAAMVQRNIQHPNNTERAIRRRTGV